ncbi:unnamed protein product [Umbelopsis vinacea]
MSSTSPNSSGLYHSESIEQLSENRKIHSRRGSAPPETDSTHTLPLSSTHVVDHRHRSPSYTNSFHKPFLPSSTSSITGTSIRTELDGSVIFHPDEDHPGKRYWESLFQPDRAFSRRLPGRVGTGLHESNSMFSFNSAATTPRSNSVFTMSAMTEDAINRPPPTSPRVPPPNVNRYDVLSNIKPPHQSEHKPIDKKQFEKLISQEKGLNDDSYSDSDLKAIYSRANRSKSSPPSLLEEGRVENTEIDKHYGKWYFWAGFICPLLWIMGGTYPSRGRKNRTYLNWRRRNRAAFTVFMTLLVVLLIVGLILKPDFLGVRTSSGNSYPATPTSPDVVSSNPNATGTGPSKSTKSPVNAADASP